jgi:hypothetical protein
VGGAQAWREAAHRFGFPVVVKRKDSSSHLRDKKALILAGAAQLGRVLAEIAASGDAESFVLQRFVPGVRHNCHSRRTAAASSPACSRKCCAPTRPTAPASGWKASSVAPPAELRAYCERLLYRLGYSWHRLHPVPRRPRERRSELPRAQSPSRQHRGASPAGSATTFRTLRSKSPAQHHPAPFTHAVRDRPPLSLVYGDLNAWRQGKVALPVLARRATRLRLSPRLARPLPGVHLFWRKLRARRRASDARAGAEARVNRPARTTSTTCAQRRAAGCLAWYSTTWKAARRTTSARAPIAKLRGARLSRRGPWSTSRGGALKTSVLGLPFDRALRHRASRRRGRVLARRGDRDGASRARGQPAVRALDAFLRAGRARRL